MSVAIDRLHTTHHEEPAVRILIADDHALFRDSLASLLATQHHEVIGQASSGREAVESVRRLRPELVLMDLDMPELGGLDATRIICAEVPGV